MSKYTKLEIKNAVMDSLKENIGFRNRYNGMTGKPHKYSVKSRNIMKDEKIIIDELLGVVQIGGVNGVPIYAIQKKFSTIKLPNGTNKELNPTLKEI